MREKIEFDLQDRNLFEVSDLRLRADALKHSILPRLQLLMNLCVDMVRDVYGVEVLEDSIFSLSPNFRMKRDREIQVDYQWASVQLGGKRKLGLWPGIERQDGKPVQIIPYLFGFVVMADGLGMGLRAHFAKGLTEAAKRGVLELALRHGPLISDLCRWADMGLDIPDVVGAKHIMADADRWRLYLDQHRYDWEIFSEVEEYPVGTATIQQFMFRFVVFYPVYDLCLRYAKGESDRFEEMVGKANSWLAALRDEGEDEESNPTEASPITETTLLQDAEKRVKVMPALRWQVFQRDAWKCVACGRHSHDGVLLHVDHVLPRSLGGKDALDNLQTLCGECNIGKSNRDNTNLRRQTPK